MDTNLMAADKAPKRPSYFKVFACKCPRCRKGNMFADSNPYHLKSTMKMNDTCPVCGQQFDLEVGFYYGSGYVSYALSVAISAATLVAWWLTIGMGLYDNRFIYWLVANGVVLVALQPLLMRLARAIWISFFVGYNPKWREQPAAEPERVNNDYKNAW
ncbi:DUF983 domain-containing protein [Chitinophaga horti]|uniref:DUF983 domain-containing protein n=1 Tax=Chitinophaga horti TaxID=2920382 RepID=A0ABY6J7T5_9BACT|nr:DUF983 domain-containing protein [Chitinophaga horti]UYQ95386.1 DUF983 domain-containing protein [Chitinophaga horti]